MVNTRSGYNRENRIEQSGIDRNFDEDDNMSVADHYTEDHFNNDIESDVRSIERDHEKHRIEQRFLEMNRQIGELTSIVRALTDKLANSREENDRDVLNLEASTRSDSFRPRIIAESIPVLSGRLVLLYYLTLLKNVFFSKKKRFIVSLRNRAFKNR